MAERSRPAVIKVEDHRQRHIGSMASSRRRADGRGTIQLLDTCTTAHHHVTKSEEAKTQPSNQDPRMSEDAGEEMQPEMEEWFHPTTMQLLHGCVCCFQAT